MFKKFQADIRQFLISEQKTSWLLMLMMNERLWAIAEHRFNHWVYYEVHIPGIRQLLRVCGVIAHKIVGLLAGIELPKEAHIGEGLYIAHKGEVVLHPMVSMGKHCVLSQGVTIGEGGRGNKKGWPQIGDRVYIAPGAKIFGPITIGNDVAIGANAVVNKDFENSAVVVGIPAKTVSHKGSSDFIKVQSIKSSSKIVSAP